MCRNLLILDDESSVHESLKLILSSVPVEIDSAYIPSEAFQKIQQKEYDAIICDYNMPEMTGVDFLRKIQAQGFQGNTLLFTGNPTILAIYQLAASDQFQVMEKPIADIDIFVNQITQLLTTKQTVLKEIS